jgi:hypothetical protein
VNVLAMVLSAGLGLSLGVGSLVFVGRAVSGARFNRALRAYVPPAEGRTFERSLRPVSGTLLMPAFRRLDVQVYEPPAFSRRQAV